MTSLFGVLLVVSLSVLVPRGGLGLEPRLVPPPLRESYNSVSGTIYIPLCGLFGVMSAFMIGLGWEEFDGSRDRTQREASALAAVYWRADELPKPEQRRVQQLCRSYARTVIQEEWPLMSQEKESERAQSIVNDLQNSINEFNPSTAVQAELEGQLVKQVDDLGGLRELRLVDSTASIPSILWVLLLGAGSVVISFTYLFGVQHFWMHSLMVGVVTAVAATALLTIESLDYPFTGAAKVSPHAFERVLQDFEAGSEN